jgi:hypothetical protein
MNDPMKDAKEIIIKYYGAPDSVLEVSDVDGRALQVLVYRPIEEEELNETWFITAGFSSVFTSVSSKPVEIYIDVTGRMSPEAEKEMAAIFVNALHDCFQEKMPAADQLLPSVNLSPVFNTTAGMLVSADLDQLVYLDEEATTYVLQLYPLFDKELEALKQIPTSFRHRTLLLSKINWFDATRTAENVLEKTLTNEWRKVISWYSEHATNLLSELQAGQSPEELNKLEQELRFVIPKDLRISLSLHNGGLPLYQYTLLTTNEILTWHRNVKEEIKKHSFLLAEDKYYWPARATPFAGDFKMNVIAVRPSIDETEDNVFLFNLSYGYSKSKWSCFLHWLHDYAITLQQGKFVLDETGKKLLPAG